MIGSRIQILLHRGVEDRTVVGLVVHALGFDPPAVVILGWWLILVLYVLLSIGAALWSSFA